MQQQPELKPIDISRLTPEEKVVLALIRSRKITQREIARSADWLGCHPEHEKDICRGDGETTTRQVRQVIRNLRINHSAPILSDSDGYWLARTPSDGASYLRRLEQTARAQAKAHMVTYNTMRRIFGISSDYFDHLAQVEKKAPPHGQQLRTGL